MDKDMRIALATSLFEKALRINGLTQRKKSLTGDMPTVFAEFAGHVASVFFEIYISGWDTEAPSQKLSLQFDSTDGDFMVCYKTISSLLDEAQKKAEEILAKAVAADA